MIIQLLNAAQLSMLLFLLAVGLSVVFGLMNFFNLAHGTLFMVGAYIGLQIAVTTGSFWLALLGAPAATALIGSALYLLLFRRLQGGEPLRQVLLTFGLIFVGLDAVRMIWGNHGYAVDAPELLTGSVSVFGADYPTYRLFVIVVGLAVLALLWLLLDRTRIGATVRAAVDDGETAQCVGIDIDRLFFWIFALGCFLAGLAGIVAAPVLSVSPGMDMNVLILTLIVVVIGGPGSLKGAALGAVLIGFVDTYGRVFLPGLALIAINALMAVVLLLRPQGLIPVK
jgi:branched-chain amino acid transport system permease protein